MCVRSMVRHDVTVRSVSWYRQTGPAGGFPGSRGARLMCRLQARPFRRRQSRLQSKDSRAQQGEVRGAAGCLQPGPTWCYSPVVVSHFAHRVDFVGISEPITKLPGVDGPGWRLSTFSASLGVESREVTGYLLRVAVSRVGCRLLAFTFRVQ